MGKSNYFKSNASLRKIRFGGQTKTTPRESESKKRYYDLLGGITLKKDVEFMDLIIKNREQWRHRVTCFVDLQHKGRIVAGLEMQSVFIDHGYDAISYWIGQKLDYFPQQVEQFKAYMSGKGIKAFKITQNLANGDKGKDVHYVDLKFEMA